MNIEKLHFFSETEYYLQKMKNSGKSVMGMPVDIWVENFQNRNENFLKKL